VKNRVLLVTGLVAILLGGVWALQGSGVLGGSSMSNSTTWLLIGIAVVLAGLILIALGVRRRST
jgi:hypothetical protein